MYLICLSRLMDTIALNCESTANVIMKISVVFAASLYDALLLAGSISLSGHQ